MLALNSGSSSLKFGLYAVDREATVCLFTDAAPSSGGPSACGRVEALVAHIAQSLRSRGLPAPQAVGHRVVHGGPALHDPVRIDTGVLHQLTAATAFAPLHMPMTLALVAAARAVFPGLPQVACFDTGFHARLPELAWRLPLPRALAAEGIRRYGFHGLSCESIVQQLGDALPGRLLIAHLGQGASITAVRDGVSIDTSMGLTPSGGLPMGTRSGDLDPGVLIHLLRSRQLDADALEDLLDRHSGLAGVAGSTGDMRALHAAARSSGDARLAIAMFCCAVAKTLAAMAAALEGVDMVVFTGGIGENDTVVREAVCARLGFIGVLLDGPRHAALHGAAGGVISREGARCEVRVLPSLEDAQIVRHAFALR